MPMIFTSASAAPAGAPAPAAKYSPARTSPGMTGNTAPLPNAPAPQQQAPAEPGQEEQQESGTEEQQPDADLSRRLGIVAQKDRKARERLDEARAAEASVKAREEQLAAREASLKAEEERRAGWRKNPKALLQDHGFVPEAALQFMLAGEKLSPEQRLAITVDERLAAERAAVDERLEAMREEQRQEQAKREAEDAEQAKQELSQQEQIAVQELQADIGEIVAGDPKAFALVRKAGKNGIAAVYEHLSTISDQQYKEMGRRPPITTKMLERAAREIEAAARKEMQEAMADPDWSQAVGVGTVRQAVAPRTLTNRLPPATTPPPAGERQETEAEKRERVKRELDGIFERGRARR